VAMGVTGSDVAKEAADLVLLTDDFSALTVGVEEGRKLYDNLKKCICYSMTTNIPEIIPFMLLIILRFPIPVTTVLLLCLSIGTDMFPAISYAYEEAELDIMVKKPRDREEHLVTKKLLTYCYLQIGIFESFAAFLTYYIAMSDFGFSFWSLIGLSTLEGYKSNPGDIYDPYSPTFGNSNLVNACVPPSTNNLSGGSVGSLYTPDWIYLADDTTDMRMVYVKCDTYANGTLTGGLANIITFSSCQVQQISSITGNPICYTSEAVKYAQMGYMISVVVCQWSNVTINKTRRSSVWFHGFRNHYMLWGQACETIFCFVLAYLPFLNVSMATRDVSFVHFGTAALPFSLLILVYDESRKLLVANSFKGVKGNDMPGWWARNFQY